MGSYIPFSEEQREQARRTDLAAFLRQCGEEVRKSGTEKYVAGSWTESDHPG